MYNVILHVFFTVTLCRARQQYLRPTVNGHILVELWSVFTAKTVQIILFQLQKVSAREDGGGSTHHTPGLQASAAIVGHPPSETAHAAITLPPVAIQPNIRPDVTQRKVRQRMKTGQHVKAQIEDL